MFMGAGPEPSTVVFVDGEQRNVIAFVVYSVVNDVCSILPVDTQTIGGHPYRAKILLDFSVFYP